MNHPISSLSVNVDVTNPGQFFACCGLLELAHRLWPGAEGSFEAGRFKIGPNCGGATISSVAAWLRHRELAQDDADADNKTCPLRLQEKNTDGSGGGCRSVLLDWWRDDTSVGGSLKTWAGQQSVTDISSKMLGLAVDEDVDAEWLDRAKAAQPPFYFDARRFAHALDTGFSLDAQGAETVAHPAVELLCLIGLQRFRPRRSFESKWRFEYWTWLHPLGAPVAAAAACGAVETPGSQGYRFSLQFRDNQKRYKAFGFATPIGGDA